MGSSLSKPGTGKVWTLEKVKEGFAKFYADFGRYPTSNEVDDFDYLPSARQIQRNWGGLIPLRKQIGLDIESYGSGEARSKIALNINDRGRKLGIIVRDYLQEKFGEPFVHIERPVHMNSKDRFDFYVYAKPKNFAIDVFGTTDIRCLIKVMNMKESRYKKDNILKNGEFLYFIYFSEYELREDIEKWIIRKKNKFLPNWKLINFNSFKKDIESLEKYSII